jgi:hypothetical protein
LNGNGDINTTFDLTARGRIIYSITGDLIERVFDGSVNYSATATIDTGIREDNTSNNTVANSIFLGFSDGFE